MPKHLLFCLIFAVILSACAAPMNTPTVAPTQSLDPVNLPVLTITPRPTRTPTTADFTQAATTIPSATLFQDPLSPPSPTLQLTFFPTPLTVLSPTLQPTLSPTLQPTLFLTPSPTSTPREPVLGIQIYRTQDEIQYGLVRQAGASWTHFEVLPWDLIEPARREPAVYNWSRVDEQALLWVAEQDLNLIATVAYAPSWAQKVPGYSCGPIAEDALERFGDFMFAAVERYSQPPYNIHHWELGNEPDILPELVPLRSPFGCWGVKGDPYLGGEYYADMLRVVYPRIKAADPQAQVVVGGLLLSCDPLNPPVNSQGKALDCSSSLFLEGILKNGGGNFFDGISLHAYDYYYRYGRYGNTNWRSNSSEHGPVLNAKVNFVRGLLEKYGYADKFLMATEVALLCRNSGLESQCVTGEYDETKAFYIAQSMAASYANHLNVSMWFHLTGWRGSQLAKVNGQTLSAYQVYQFGFQMMEGAEYLAPVQGYEKVYGYNFRRGNQQFWLVWSRDDTPGAEVTLLLPEMPQAIYNVYGEKLDPALELRLTVAPLYIVWQR